MVRYSFNTWNHSTLWDLPPTLPTQIAAAGRVGYDFVGLDIPSLLAHRAAGLSPSAVAGHLGDHGIACFEIVPLSITGDLEATTGQLDLVAELAVAVGAAQVLAVVRSPVDAATVEATRRCVERLADLGIGTSVEFLPTLPLDSIGAVRALLDAIDRPELRIVVDVWHFFAGPDDWAALDDLPLPQLGFVQFSDAPAPLSHDVEHEYRHRRALPGQGVLDLDRFSAGVRARWPDVTVSVEVLSELWRRRPPDELVAASIGPTRRYWEGG